MKKDDRVVLARDWFGRHAGQTGTVWKVEESLSVPGRVSAFVRWDAGNASWCTTDVLRVLPPDEPAP